MQRSILLSCFSLAILTAHAAPLDLASPDGKVSFRLSTDAEGHLLYSVTAGGKPRLEPAQAGVIVGGVDLGAGVTLGEPQVRSISETFPWRGNKTTAANVCRAYEIPVQTREGAAWTLEVRVFDDGAGFRYRVPGTGERKIQGESTGWQLPRTAKVWFQTRTGSGSYEGVYRSARADQLPREEKIKDRDSPVHLGPPVTVEFDGGGYGLISEAALYRYSGMTLKPEGDARLSAAFVNDPKGWSHEGPILSPWRVFIFSEDLNGLVNSDLIPALCDPPDPELFPDGIHTKWLETGKAPCTWMVYHNAGAQWYRQKWFVDMAAATGCEFLLVDAGWNTERWGWFTDGSDMWERAAELCRYAAERKVGIILWHAYPENMKSFGPGLTTIEAREEFFRRCREAGVKGVKIDFFRSESKEIVEAQEDLLRRAAKYQLTVNFHGCHKPTGEARTWPNEISREGIREQEFALREVLPLEHYGSLPFTRMAVGHADFLPGYVQRRTLKTSPIFQMALTVVATSPFLCWPDNPEAYLHSPLLQFVRTVPVTWDETRILPGSAIGETVIMARRKGDEWYVAALNCRPEARTLDLDLSSLEVKEREMTLYLDGASDAGCRIESGVQPPADGRLSLELRSGGGVIVHIRTPKIFDLLESKQ